MESSSSQRTRSAVVADMLDRITIGGGCSEPEVITPDTSASAMRWVAALAGEAWGTEPSSACPYITEWVKAINYGTRDDGAFRTQLLRPLIPRIAESKRSPDIVALRILMGVDFLVRDAAP